jgi:inorganic pyrophosphatase
MHNFIDLEPYGDNRQLRMIVETPRGSNIKLEYEPKLRAFTVSRALPLGLVYPYDWGFIPGTKGEAIQLTHWRFMTEPPIQA